MTRGVADSQVSVFPVAVQEGIVEKQSGKQKTHQNLPSGDRYASVRGLCGGHLPEFDTSTLGSIAARVKRMPAPAFQAEEVGIIARGAMIPVVGSITEVQTLRVSEA